MGDSGPVKGGGIPAEYLAFIQADAAKRKLPPGAKSTEMASGEPLKQAQADQPKANLPTKKVKSQPEIEKQVAIPGSKIRFGKVQKEDDPLVKLEKQLGTPSFAVSVKTSGMQAVSMPGSSLAQIVGECAGAALKECSGQTISINVRYSSSKQPAGATAILSLETDGKKKSAIRALEATLKEHLGEKDLEGTIVISSGTFKREIEFEKGKRSYDMIAEKPRPLLREDTEDTGDTVQAFSEELAKKLEDKAFKDTEVSVYIRVQRAEETLDFHEESFSSLSGKNIDDLQDEIADLLKAAVGKKAHVQMRIESSIKNTIIDYPFEDKPSKKS
jgi:hypothetical protein